MVNTLGGNVIYTTKNLFYINGILNDLRKVKSYISANGENISSFINRFQEIIIKVNKGKELTLEEIKIIELFKTKKLEFNGENDLFKKEKFFISGLLNILLKEEEIFRDFIDDLYLNAKKPEGYIFEQGSGRTILSLEELISSEGFISLDLGEIKEEVKDLISKNIS